ncbi:ribosome maturation factor RimM [Clostridium tepidiprofundi DSM 19306]|uniref:Ribosome maturation factor RimM n=1 Tax=Clostridium tepidiprofundi DSM 19306 TaxID=1121338 RepID=A0A151B7U7_9CLOT|nr:ribosome maturation factor RimM [Clostridium tepidiprofundi]KYH35883.1 ribosome maturation factor RimM [Clostridium tepidiprofundi DSM 19306]
MEDFIIIGQISKTHGIKGEVKVLPLTADVNRFKKLKTVFIDDIEKRVLGCKFQSKRIVLKIEGIDTIEEAEKYKNKYLYIQREDAIKLSEGEFYVADIIDCSVYEENGKELGKVYDVIETGSNDVYWIKEGKDKKELLIPALKTIVQKIDIENKKIIIKPVKEWME